MTPPRLKEAEPASVFGERAGGACLARQDGSMQTLLREPLEEGKNPAHGYSERVIARHHAAGIAAAIEPAIDAATPGDTGKR